MPFDGTNLNETARILIEAKALIDKPERWCKRAMQMGDSRCAIGALVSSAGWDRWADALYQARLADALRDFVPARFQSFGRNMSAVTTVTTFNDDHATTHADVMALFDKAIAKASAQ